MSDFKTKMRQIQFRLGLRPRPLWGAYSPPQTAYLDLRGLLLRGGEVLGNGKEREREKRNGEGRERGRRREGRLSRWRSSLTTILNTSQLSSYRIIIWCDLDSTNGLIIGQLCYFHDNATITSFPLNTHARESGAICQQSKIFGSFITAHLRLAPSSDHNTKRLLIHSPDGRL